MRTAIFASIMEIGVLFDLDGVVIDSESIYTKFWSEMGRIYPTGIPDFAIKIKGTTLPRILSTYFPDKKVQNDIRRKIVDFEAGMKYIPFAEAIRFIKELKEAGIKRAIVTSSLQDKMDALYAQNPGFRELFDEVITGDMVTRSKPDPQPYLIGAEKLGLKIENCYVFEDSLSGIKSGMASGATVIALATSLPFSEVNGKAHKTISDFTGFHISDMLAAGE